MRSYFVNLLSVVLTISLLTGFEAFAQQGPPPDPADAMRPDPDREEPVIGDEPPLNKAQEGQPADLPAADNSEQGPSITGIRFEGLLRIDQTSAVRRIKSRPGDHLDLDRVSEDIRALYTMGAFTDITARVQDSTGGILLVFDIKERPAVDKILIEGNDEVDDEDLEKKVFVKTAQILDMRRVEQSADAIRSHYVDEGFFLAEVDWRLEEKPQNLVDLVFVIREHAKVKVQNIEFSGNEHIKASEIKKIMQTREGSLMSFLTGEGTFAREAFEIDLQRIVFFYNTRGYAEVRVEDPVVMLSRDRRFINISVRIEEGEQYTVDKVDVGGDMLFPHDEILAKVSLKSGEIFNAEKVQADITTLSHLYKDQGYAFATVQPDTRLDREKRLISFTYNLQKGDLANFGHIDIVGNAGTRDWTIRREMKVFEGDIYNETRLRESEARIRRLGFFENVVITPRPGVREGEVDVTVDVKERQTGSFSVGAGFSSMENFLFQAQISKQNFLGRGQTLRLEAMLSSLRKHFSFTFDDPYFMDSNWTFGLTLRNLDYSQYTFTQVTRGLQLTVGHRFFDDFTLAVDYRLDWIDVGIGGIRGFGDVPVANLDISGITSSLSLIAGFDNRDDRMFPTKGNVSSISLEWSGSEIGSDFDYIRLQLRTRQYFPIFWGIIGKVALNYGYIFSPKDQDIPIFERFQVGGIYTVRGFERASLGPTIPVGSARDPSAYPVPFTIGGAQQLIMTVEAEFPIFQQLGVRGVVFFDAGNAFDDNELPNPLELRPAAGFGIRWWSPIGPLRFEWGFPIQPLAGEPSVVFEFNIGTF